MLTAEELKAHVAQRLGSFLATDTPVALRGGYLNFVWRLPGRPASIVVKVAPPYVASAPEISLSADRLSFEAAALSLFREGGRLQQLAQGTIGVPGLLDFDRQRHMLILQDLGEGPTLDQVAPDHLPPKWATQLGAFVSGLHATTFGDQDLAREFDNRAVQASRDAVQYQRIQHLLEQAGIDKAAALSGRAGNLGKRLLLPGRCLTMGDLWPRSLLPRGERLYLIDWEFAHVGNPAQDLGHLAAHLWMLGHCKANRRVADAWATASKAFLREYGRRAATIRGLLDEAVAEDAAIHFGCELLARTVGPFQRGYFYEGLASESAPVKEAVAAAVRHLAAPRETEIFRDLAPSALG